MQKIVFLSGPIRGVPDYKEKFAAAGQLLLESGHKVINPANMDYVLKGEGVTDEDYMKADTLLLSLADAICMLPGWEHSMGAKQERDWMRRHNREIWEVTNGEES